METNVLFEGKGFSVLENGQIVGNPNLRGVVFELARLLQEKEHEKETIRSECENYKEQCFEYARKALSLQDCVRVLIQQHEQVHSTVTSIITLLPDKV